MLHHSLSSHDYHTAKIIQNHSGCSSRKINIIFCTLRFPKHYSKILFCVKKQTINAKCGPEMSRTSFNGCRYMCSTYCNKAVTNCHLGWKPWAAKFIMSLKKKQHRQASPFLWLNVSQIWPNFGLLPPVVKFFFFGKFFSCLCCFLFLYHLRSKPRHKTKNLGHYNTMIFYNHHVPGLKP